MALGILWPQMLTKISSPSPLCDGPNVLGVHIDSTVGVLKTQMLTKMPSQVLHVIHPQVLGVPVVLDILRPQMLTKIPPPSHLCDGTPCFGGTFGSRCTQTPILSWPVKDYSRSFTNIQ